LIIGSKHATKNAPKTVSLQVGSAQVPAVSTARNIGAVMDQSLSMNEHVKAVCKSSYMQLRNIGRIRRYLTDDAAATLIHSLVISKLDNLNSLLVGLPDNVIQKLQLIQNQAAKIVSRNKKFDHVTPILIKLHWLPVQFRIQYKVLLLTHKCIHGGAPQYLSSLLEEYKPARTLRSANQCLLKEKKCRLKSYGERAFSVAAPRLWNTVPLELRLCECEDSFKKQLKTFLFKKAFNV
jgi:hypothetical protein